MHHWFLRYILAQKHQENRGFALAYSLTCGLISVTLTSAIITVAFNQKEATKIQQNALQFTYDEHTVETRLKYFFHKFPYLLSSNSSDWEKSITNPSSQDGTQLINYSTTLCGQIEDSKARQNQISQLAQGEKQQIGYSNFSLINFKRVNNNKSLATLRVENQQGVSADIEATINYDYSPRQLDLEADLPALRLKSGNTGRGQVDGQVEIYDPTCQFPINRINVVNRNTQQPRFIPNNFSHNLDIFDIKRDLSSSNQVTLDDSYEGKTITLPLPESVPISTHNEKPTYEYVISKDFSGDVSIDANSKVNGQPVVNIIHFEGDVENVHLTHKCGESTDTNCPAENLVIIGYEHSEICLIFDQLNALIVAPDSQVGINFKTANQSVINFTGSLSAEKLLTMGSCGNGRLIFNESIKLKDVPKKLQFVNSFVNIDIDIKRESKDNNLETTEPPPEPRPQDARPFPF